MTSQSLMLRTIDIAKKAALVGEVPVGAIICCDGNIIAEAENRVYRNNDPTAHAEILALRKASSLLGSKFLVDCDMYVSLEPCAMCAGAISLARIRRLYFAAYDAKSGGVDHGAKVFDHKTCHHKPEVIGGIEEVIAAKILNDFFEPRRK